MKHICLLPVSFLRSKGLDTGYIRRICRDRSDPNWAGRVARSGTTSMIALSFSLENELLVEPARVVGPVEAPSKLMECATGVIAP